MFEDPALSLLPYSIVASTVKYVYFPGLVVAMVTMRRGLSMTYRNRRLSITVLVFKDPDCPIWTKSLEC
jgi:hypothetical protein